MYAAMLHMSLRSICDVESQKSKQCFLLDDQGIGHRQEGQAAQMGQTVVKQG